MKSDLGHGSRQEGSLPIAAGLAPEIVEYKTRPGRAHPLGATVHAEGVNFAFFSQHATGMELPKPKLSRTNVVAKGTEVGVTRSHFKAAQLQLEGDLLNMGRAPDNHVVVNDKLVSRRHSVLKREGSGYVLEDLGTPNGTYVNNQRVQRHVLGQGDVIRLGHTLYTYRVPVEGAGYPPGAPLP